ncbi:hypothetical protein [Parafrigoribacterium humi]|uniref:hypothetical protein n=1 Tax=Parafrigoribacterium humi TaxID=3144664 RepID=UPI0032ED7ACE
MKEENIVVTSFSESAEHATRPTEPAASDSRASRDNIVIESLSATQWRICDTRWPEHDARSVLGFIEKKDEDLFEVMQLSDGFEWFSFASLRAAAAHFTQAQSSAPATSENVLSRLRAHA